MVSSADLKMPSFWWFQATGWCCFCLVCVMVVLPYSRQPWELGYQGPVGLFADQGFMCLGIFLASLPLRPMCRSLLQLPLTWVSMEIRALGWSLVLGTSAALGVSRVIIASPEPMELLEACLKASALLFLWCNLYFGVKQSLQRERKRPEQIFEQVEAKAIEPRGETYASHFTVRTGSRVQIVPVPDVEWIAGAGDYSELHTRSGNHLFRETMNSLEQKLDNAGFVRIHRSKIVNLARISELRAIDNREYIVKLCDGSQHRSSRTYAARLERWLDSGGSGK